MAAGLLLFAVLAHFIHRHHDVSRILFKTKGGPVVFDHRLHTDKDGPGLECGQCHHNDQQDAAQRPERNCRKCHYNNKDIRSKVCTEEAVHKRCIGKQCADCHGVEDCTLCHKK